MSQSDARKPSEKPTRCRDCRFYALPPTVTRVSRYSVYPCDWLGDAPKVPASMYLAYGGFKWPPQKSYMGPEDGAGCATFERKAKPNA